jgi:two-component system, response regulator / RNA-binding antiterminator
MGAPALPREAQILPPFPPMSTAQHAPPAHAPSQAGDAQRTLRVLLVDDGAHRVSLIRDALLAQGCDVVGVIDSAPVLHDSVAQLEPDVVIVDAESPSRDTLEHLATLSAHSPRPVVVFTEDDADDLLRQAMAAGVSAYVVAGLQPGRVAAVLRVAIARFEQESALRGELAQARGKLESRKRIERAKGILMRARGIGEDEAYRQLRKLAMDRGERLAQVAERVIAANDLLGTGG